MFAGDGRDGDYKPPPSTTKRVNLVRSSAVRTVHEIKITIELSLRLLEHAKTDLCVVASLLCALEYILEY